MTLDRWITIILLVGGAIVQMALVIDAWVHRRSDNEQRMDGRLVIVERDLERIRDKSSEEASRWQKWIGDTEVRLARYELLLNDPIDRRRKPR